MRRLFRHELLRRSALFSLSIVASTLVGVFSLPVLIATVGAEQWGHLAVMQAITQFASVIVAFGWGATGPSMVSAIAPEERKAVFMQSFSVRGTLFAVVLVPTVILCAQLTGQSWINAVLAAGTYTFAGLSAAWYFVGTNRPIPLFLLDATPSIVGQVLGLVAVLITGDLTAYLACTAALTAVGVAASMVYVVTRPQDGPRRAARPTPWREILRSQSAGVSSTISASMWTAAPTVLVQAFAPAAVPVFAMIDRLMKYGVLALAPILQAIQGWVPESGRATVGARAVTGVKVATGVGLLGGVALAALSTPVSSLLSLGEAVVPWTVAVIAGAAFAFECVAQIAGLSGLVALGGSRQLALSSIASAVVGIPVIAALVIWLGLYGAILGILIVAAALAVYRAVHVRRYARRYV
ncbi:lipopolysaccharide biosynthesis protein [uncultured Microbacterium sp.]|uniref:lipopolysaccharide biosynthesis protein n=1 Tax=uncultured Microbacterium sp. TaxID=191216 RepID=UPI0025ECC628|nr:oligosaccharide flippase family protein [uncultured Microbacterium sp.]